MMKFRSGSILSSLLLVSLSACRHESAEEAAAALSAGVPGDAIAAHTEGEVSVASPIRVVFQQSQDDVALGKALADNPFAFAPEIDGEAVWVSRTEIQFQPAEHLTQGRVYRAQFALPARNVPAFGFSFVGMRQGYTVEVTGLRVAPGDEETLERQELLGIVTTADVASGEDVEKMLSITGQPDLKVAWQHEPVGEFGSGGRDHRFTVGGIRRGDRASDLHIVVDGEPIGVDDRQERTATVPALTSFEVSSVRAVLTGTNHIEIKFSDPLSRKQDLSGLIKVEGQDSLRISKENDVVRLYTNNRWGSGARVDLSASIKNRRGTTLGADSNYTVQFATPNPEVRFAGKGVIYPTTRGLVVPIETMNLNAIDVEAIRVPVQNLPQFLQVNDLGGDNELKRVGRPVWRSTVTFDAGDRGADKDRWVRRGLDVEGLVSGHPPGLYRLRLSFRRGQINYACDTPYDSSADEPLGRKDGNWDGETDNSWWNYAEGYYGDVPYWEMEEQRHNPCHTGYYRKFWDHDISQSRNVLVSDIGVIAKRGTDGSMTVVTTDLREARPLPGAKVEVLSYQREVMGEGTTDAQGMLNVSPRGFGVPYVVTVGHGDQVGVIRVDAGSALSMAHFDIGGAKVEHGLKGFFYGERGVWRPGDDIYLTFVLYDPSGRLPEDHPLQFDLVNPRGQRVADETRGGSAHGVYVFKTKTSPDDPTGNYVASVEAGGATFKKVLKIETVVPNRLKIDLAFDEKPEAGRTPRLTRQDFHAVLKSQWLHGAIARNLEAEIQVAFASTPTRFGKFAEYSFDDPTRRGFHTDPVDIFQSSLDDNGEASVNGTLSWGSGAPGMLRATFTTRVYEPAGAASVQQQSVELSPYKRYVGLRPPKGDRTRGMLLTDTQHTVDLAAVDPEGNPTDAEVEVKLFQIGWRWWWDKSEENLPDFATASSFHLVSSGKAAIKNGRGQWKFEAKYPAWGRYLLTVSDEKGGHRAGKIVYIDWPGWAGRAQKDSPGGASVLTFTSDRPSYDVGEKVTLNIPTPNQGRALVSLESGSRVLKAEWLECTGKETQYTFEAEPAMAPGIYANVTLLQPHLSTANDLPLRMYGVVPISVVNDNSVLDPELTAPDVLEPMSTATISVKEAEGRPMTYTVALVDEGLLGLTNFSTPDPWHSFYQREALGVTSWDLFDDVAGAYGGKLETMLAIGGGEEEAEGKRQRANRFEPMVRFIGPFNLAAGGVNRHDIDIPQYVGAVRIMVVAAEIPRAGSGGVGAFGSTAKSVPVKKPVMLLATLPRVLGPREKVDLPVSVFALEDRIKAVDVRVSVPDDDPLQVSGDAKQRVEFKGSGDKIITFKLKVKDQLGVGHVTIRASSANGKDTAEQDVEIDVRHPSGRVTDALVATLKPLSTFTSNAVMPGLAGTNTATLEVSRMPPVNLAERLEYLIHYPHGCVEQTTSGAFPQLYLSDVVSLTNEQEGMVQKNVNVAIDRLASFQQSGGGFGYWPSDFVANDWTTSYAGHFLLEAKRAGYPVPHEVIDRWRKYQRQAAKSERGNDPKFPFLAQAYRLYTLALAGTPELSAMNRLRESGKLDTQTRFRLAAAYALTGQKEAATALVNGAAHGGEIEPYRELDGTLGSQVRDQAMILETYVALGEAGKAAEIARDLSRALGSREYLNTHETAYALVAMARFGARFADEPGVGIAYGWDGASKKAKISKAVFQQELAVGRKTRIPLSIKNESNGTLFARVVMRGLPKVGSERDRSHGLSLDVTYRAEGGGEMDPSKIEQGTDFIARVVVSNTSGRRKLSEIVLSQVFASGWEIRGVRTPDDQNVPDEQRSFWWAFFEGKRRRSNYVDYQDVRDDRVYSYLDLMAGQSKTFEVLLNASYAGTFYAPPTSVETMYDDAIGARKKGRWVEVAVPMAAL